MADVIVLDGLEEVKDLIKETAGMYPPSGAELGEVTNFLVSAKSETEATLTWTNNIDKDLVSVEVYQSYLDMANVDREWCLANAKRLYKGEGTTTKTSSLNIDTRVYYKIFSEYIDLGVYKYSKGICINMVPNSSNIINSFIVSNYTHSMVTLSWNASYDSGFNNYELFRHTEDLANQDVDWCKKNAVKIYEGIEKNYSDNDINAETFYSYKIFAKFNNNQYTSPKVTSVTTKPIPQTIVYGFEIDMKNPDPDTSVKYIEANAGFTPARMSGTTWSYGDWGGTKIVTGNRRVLIEHPWSSSYGSDHTMAEFDRMYYKLEVLPNDIFRFRISEERIDDTWTAPAFMDRDNPDVYHTKMRIGSYVSTDSVVTHQIKPNVTPSFTQATATHTESHYFADNVLYNIRKYWKSTETGYDLLSLAQCQYYILLCVLITKHLDAKKAIGRGFTAFATFVATKTGVSSGQQFYGNTDTSNTTVSAFYVENFWGGGATPLLGYTIEAYADGQVRMRMQYKTPYKDFGPGTPSTGKYFWHDLKVQDLYPKVIGVSNNLFYPKIGGASGTTYFSSRCPFAHTVPGSSYINAGTFSGAGISSSNIWSIGSHEEDGGFTKVSGDVKGKAPAWMGPRVAGTGNW